MKSFNNACEKTGIVYVICEQIINIYLDKERLYTVTNVDKIKIKYKYVYNKGVKTT